MYSLGKTMSSLSIAEKKKGPHTSHLHKGKIDMAWIKSRTAWNNLLPKKGP